MIVEEFNISNGLYIFEFEDFETEFHSHPLVEIIIAKTGNFTLWTDDEIHANLKFAVIPANKKHKLSSTNCEIRIVMVEHYNKLIGDNLGTVNIELNGGYFSQSKADKEIVQINKLVQEIKSGQVLIEYDYRISRTIDYLNHHELEYDLMIETLRSLTNLSESRLSHLFKSNVGISLKKYLIWSKLKSTIKNHLDTKGDLFSALIKGGFFDQPHFSKSFKTFLGVKPSKAYNSRNLQVLSNATH